MREWKHIKIDANKTEKEVYEEIKTALMKLNLYEEVEWDINLI